MHPTRSAGLTDYTSEKKSRYEIWFTFGWPYETTAAVTRLIYSGIYDELPRLKIITHHMGGMIPYFSGKITLGFSQIFFGTTDMNPLAEKSGLKRKPLDYFKMLYADTALNGAIAPTGPTARGGRRCRREETARRWLCTAGLHRVAGARARGRRARSRRKRPGVRASAARAGSADDREARRTRPGARGTGSPPRGTALG
jgi:hypothetical protein